MRLNILRLVLIFTLAVITFRLFYWQIIRFDDMSVLADQQRLVSFRLEGTRGSILAKDAAPLAINKPTFLLYGLPKVIKNKEEVAGRLAKILISADLKAEKKPDPKEMEKKKNEIIDNLSENLYWVTLSKNISPELKKEIEKQNIEGIGFDNQLSRFYPEASSAAHLLGFVGSDSLGNQTGYFGLEGFYNGELKGTGGVMIEERDAQGQPILTGRYFKQEPKSGHNLVLNVDQAVQYIIEQKLQKGMVKYGAKNGLVVVMEPKTGAILAMAAYPDYDPNIFYKFPKEAYKNPIVADAYEPGSTFKVLIMAAAINEGLVKSETKCDNCEGPIKIGEYTIKTWNNKYYPNTTMDETIIHSDNTGMVFAARKLGVDKIYNYIESFGVGKLADIDLQDETSPNLRPRKDWREIELATASFGQGIAVTPIQLLRAVSTIANGGYLMEPHVVQEIQSEGKATLIKPKVVGQPISETTARIVTSMMVEAVDKGEAKVFAPKGYKIAGKTGTAQIPVAGHYDPEKTVASFVGFAPADDPKFVILVKYTEPSSSIFGAETAAPTFFEITKELLTYFNIAPSN